MLLLLALLTSVTATEAVTVGAIAVALITIIGKQFQFNNKLIAANQKQRDDDLDKISAALIIVQEQSKAQTEICKEVVNMVKDVSESQKLLAKDVSLLTELVIKNLPTQP